MLTAIYNGCVLSRILPQYSGLEFYKTCRTSVIFVCFPFINGRDVGLKPRTVIKEKKYVIQGVVYFVRYLAGML